jgi:glycerol-3-phosphate dehydrogenase
VTTPPGTIRPGADDLPAEVDLVVAGLGVTGAGVALDAASRELTVLAVDAHDVAFGTSRWSSKLVHGGLRYLAHGQVGVAHESAVERRILMETTAPHLTHALPMLVPLHEQVGRGQAATTRAGLLAGDLLRIGARTHRDTLPRPDPRPVSRQAPPARAGSRRPRRSPSHRRCASAGCAAACSAGTASSRTTPAWC